MGIQGTGNIKLIPRQVGKAGQVKEPAKKEPLDYPFESIPFTENDFQPGEKMSFLQIPLDFSRRLYRHAAFLYPTWSTLSDARLKALGFPPGFNRVMKIDSHRNPAANPSMRIVFQLGKREFHIDLDFTGITGSICCWLHSYPQYSAVTDEELVALEGAIKLLQNPKLIQQSAQQGR